MLTLGMFHRRVVHLSLRQACIDDMILFGYSRLCCLSTARVDLLSIIFNVQELAC